MSLLQDLIELFFPRTCRYCRRELEAGELGLCLSCQTELPRLAVYGRDNRAEKALAGKFPFQKGVAFCYYKKGSRFSHLLHEAKYEGKPWINHDLATLFAAEIEPEGWPGDIDLIVPVPIHWRRRLSRGYNQCEEIARALGRRWNIAVETNALCKCRHTRSQVHSTYYERLSNLRDSFTVKSPEKFIGRHILIVDDVLTSGATLDACAHALLEVQSVRISFLTLGISL